MKKYLPTFFLVFLFSSLHGGEKINFLEVTSDTWEEIKTLAVKENKFIFAYDYDKPCNECKEIENKVFADTAVIKFMNDKFICIKGKEKEEEKITSGMFQCRSGSIKLPAGFFILTNDGKVFGRNVFPKEPEKFLELLKTIITKTKN